MRKHWFKMGCLGCLGILGVLLLIAAGIAGTAWLRAHREKVADQVLTPEIPETAPPPAGARGKVVLDLAHAERFVIEKASSGSEPLRVEATYDTNTYELKESFEKPQDAPWTYRVRFHRKSSWMATALKEALSGSKPSVRILLSPEVAIDLELHLREGGLEARLGGLQLHSADLEVAKGGLELHFDEPLRAPMERFTLHGEMGGFVLASLGNASPRSAEIDCSMGGMEIDLRGAWAGDSEISIHSRMAGGRLRLPRNAVVRGVPSSHVVAPEAGEGAKLPVLTLSVSATMGEVEIEE